MTSRKAPRERIPWYPPVRAEACSGCEPKCPAGAIRFPDMETISDLIKKLRDNLRRS
jgi:ferredoxin